MTSLALTDIPPVVVARHALVGPPLCDDGQLLVPDHLLHVGGGGLTLDLAQGDHLPAKTFTPLRENIKSDLW